MKINRLEIRDLRFPTSRWLDGSDAMNEAPDYSAAYVTLHTDGGLQGHGFTFTIGRGNELCCAAIAAYAPLVEGLELSDITADMGNFWRKLAGDSQLRWVGPEKGVIHLAVAAIVNAVWDLWARSVGKPVWQLVADLSPDEFASLIDYRSLSDVITRDGVRDRRTMAQDGLAARRAKLLAEGYPAYSTSAGWLGYSDEKLSSLCTEAVAMGWDALKFKVGRDLADDKRRCAIARQALGPGRRLMIDANQVWEIEQAIDWIHELSEFDPYWIEEPISPDDVFGHARIAKAIAPLRVATGEHVPNRVVFKQLLQAEAMSVVQFDNCRLGGLNEAIAVLVLADKFGKPVCPHAGGVGLCQYAPHISAIDYLCVSGSLDGRMAEYTTHLHEQFVSPIRVTNGRYVLPRDPGFGAELRQESLRIHEYPNGPAWSGGNSTPALVPRESHHDWGEVA